MNIKKWIQVLMVVSLVFILAACNDEVPKDVDPITPGTGTEVEYEVVSEQGLAEEVESWYLDSYQTEGLHVKVYEGKQYVLIAAGERPTGGYLIENVSLVDVDGKILVTGEVQGPAEDEMVTQALTYPSILLTKVVDEREFTYDGLIEKQREQQIQAADGTGYGTYIGMIDQNSVEILVLSGPIEEHRSFQLSDETKEQVKDIEDGAAVQFDSEPVEGQQDRLLFIQKSN